MPLGENEIGVCGPHLSLKGGSVVSRQDVCCDIDGTGRIRVWVVGYGKGFSTMEIAMSEKWSSD